jgi:predicted phosphodiesterase
MKIRYVSDLHLEFKVGQKRSVADLVEDHIPTLLGDEATVLVLAGDICAKRNYLQVVLEVLSKRFKHVLMVAGNHEFYGYNMNEYEAAIMGPAWTTLTNVTYVVKGVKTVYIDDVRFIMSVLWADGGSNPLETLVVQNGMWDFREITIGDVHSAQLFTAGDMFEMNKVNRERIGLALASKHDGKTIVVTHHVPSHSLCHPRHGSSMNGGFASDCGLMMMDDNAPAYWIFGHTHDTINRQLYRTQVLCNPGGYHFEVDLKYHRYDGTASIEV